MTPDQCAVLRNNLSGWMLADALCGEDYARQHIAQSVYGRSHGRDGTPAWFQCGPRGVSLGFDRTHVATWKEIGGHLATLPPDVEAKTRAAYAEYRRLWSDHCHGHGPESAARAFMAGVLEPLLDRALTYTPPSQPDIFDLLAEVP